MQAADETAAGTAGGAEPLPGRGRELTNRLRGWWREPTLNLWVLAALALLLFLRKPHSLHTPQLYAEDGSIFLVYNDLLGARALIDPYMGYLHVIPRLTAWLASRLLDVAWWPAFYNGVAFAIWVAVIARLFSPRFPLPGKPWLALAVFLGPQTGEILFNITNVQWITAFIFVQHLLLKPATTAADAPSSDLRSAGQQSGTGVPPVDGAPRRNHAQAAHATTRTVAKTRAADAVILAVVSLTGPFSILFAPLLAWRWWRERNADTLMAWLIVTAGAAVQAGFAMMTADNLQLRSGPFQPWPILEVVARRLVVWPALGNDIAHTIPGPIVTVIGWTVIAAVIALMLRPHEQRPLRARLIAAFFVMLAIGVYRCRPDTWGGDDLNFSDRYFHLPRVLLAWMLILQFHAPSRIVAWAARGLAAAMALAHLPDYTLPAPTDYRWREHCDPIRRGERADIKTLPEGWWIEYPGRPR